MNWRCISLLFPAFFSCAIYTFAQSDIAALSSVPPSQESTIDLVHLGDLIDVDVVGSFEFDWRGTLTPEGFLDGLDRADEPIFGLCRSENDLSRDITKAYAKFLRDPQVIVRILDRSSRAVVFLDGAVRSPQRLQIRRPVRLNEVLIISGGITENASGEVTIFRPKNLSCEQPPTPNGDYVNASRKDGPQMISIRIRDLLSGVKEANPQVLSGDIVTIVEALPIYVMGGVNAPRQVSARTRTTLSRAVAAAGGVSKKGLEDSVTIYRREAGGTISIQADLRKIGDQQAEDPVLQAYDIVEVSQKGSEKRKFPPILDTGGFQTSKLANLPLRIID
ncbi:MAG TPA: SLBB domain-containing protein [Pyrinomonadaceae bacterium]|nr:SLBB domain-containing protein [Pyrinomonadaceae bacterium]